MHAVVSPSTPANAFSALPDCISHTLLWINNTKIPVGCSAYWQLLCSTHSIFFSFSYHSSHHCKCCPEHSVTQIVSKLTILVLYVLTTRPYTVVYLCTSNTCNIQEKLLCLLARKRRSLASRSRHVDFGRRNTARAAWRAKISLTPWKGKGKSENMMEIITQRLFAK